MTNISFFLGDTIQNTSCKKKKLYRTNHTYCLNFFKKKGPQKIRQLQMCIFSLARLNSVTWTNHDTGGAAGYREPPFTGACLNFNHLDMQSRCGDINLAAFMMVLWLLLVGVAYRSPVHNTRHSSVNMQFSVRCHAHA